MPIRAIRQDSILTRGKRTALDFGMTRSFVDIEQQIRSLGRSDQVRLLRALLEELDALPDAMSPRVLRAEIEMDLAAANDYVARHGSFAELARVHYAAADDDAV